MTMFGYLVLLYFVLFELTVCHSLTRKPQFDEDDIKCLKEIENELSDPSDFLSTWDFDNSSQGFICNFDRVQCWHVDDGRMMSVKLPGMELSGGFPSGLKYCGRITTLDLSDNSLSGQIPRDLCKWLPFLVQLNLSSNQFNGLIPTELANCSYLNALHLNDNQLKGSIPWELTRLERLKHINFANNMLSGPIPSKWASNTTNPFQGAGLKYHTLSPDFLGVKNIYFPFPFTRLRFVQVTVHVPTSNAIHAEFVNNLGIFSPTFFNATPLFIFYG